MADLELRATFHARRPEDERFAQAANAVLEHLLLTDPDIRSAFGAIAALVVGVTERELRFGAPPDVWREVEDSLTLLSKRPFQGIIEGTEPMFRRWPLTEKGRAALEE